MEESDSNMGYIMASSIENKDSEGTLRNEDPKSEIYNKKNPSQHESTLRNEQPISERKPGVSFIPESQPFSQVEVPKRAVTTKPEPEEKKNVPRDSDPLINHRTVEESGKVVWDKTHFIIAVDAGGK